IKRINEIILNGPKRTNPERNHNMKTITMPIQKSSRWTAMVAATVVAIITCLAVANATQTITTPNAVNIPFSLAVGASSAAITPATNKPVLVMGCCTNNSVQAVGQVSLLHIPTSISTGGSITWAGYESYTPVAFTGGVATTGGTHVVYIDFN